MAAEPFEYLGVGSTVRGSLVVDLPTNHIGIVTVVSDEILDEPFGVAAEVGVIKVHILAHAVERRRPAERAGQYLRVLLVHPGWDGIRGCAHDDFDTALLIAATTRSIQVYSNLPSSGSQRLYVDSPMRTTVMPALDMSSTSCCSRSYGMYSW